MWRDDGTWARMNDALRDNGWVAAGYEAKAPLPLGGRMHHCLAIVGLAAITRF